MENGKGIVVKVIACEQNSVEWLNARCGVVTASEFNNLISPTGEIRKGEMPKSYLAKKVAEVWQGGPLLEVNVWDMDAGKILEEEARPWYEAAFDCEVKTVGFITSDDGKIGCSPDGLIGYSSIMSGETVTGKLSGIEIKCPRVETHTGYLLSGSIPKDYIAQVQGSLFVTGFNEWKFMSYRRRFPNLVLNIERDEDFIKNLYQALSDFLEKFQSSLIRMEEINGGPRPKRYTPQHAPQPDNDDRFEIVP